MGKRTKTKQCYCCGTLDNESKHVNISEDVPPRWLSGIKTVKKENCIPQCNTCRNNLAVLDNAVNEYFRYGAGVNLDIVEQNNLWTNNKSIGTRKINLNGNIDYAQSNGCLLLWLRKLLVGLWYKEKNSRFEGGMFVLVPWLSFDDSSLYVINTATPPEESRSLLFDIDDYFRYDYILDSRMKIPFKFSFINSPLINIPAPLQLLRFAIYGRFCGYCLFIPNYEKVNPKIFFPFFDKPPLHIEKWLKGFPYYQSSDVVKLVNSLKSISAEEAATRVRL
jgi:hypothetical protein